MGLTANKKTLQSKLNVEDENVFFMEKLFMENSGKSMNFFLKASKSIGSYISLESSHCVGNENFICFEIGFGQEMLFNLIWGPMSKFIGRLLF